MRSRFHLWFLAISTFLLFLPTFLPRYLLLALRCRGWPQLKLYLLMPTLALGNALVVILAAEVV